MKQLSQINKDRINAIILSKVKIKVPELLETHNLNYGLDLDSLDVVEIIFEVEKEFNIIIPDDQIEDIISVHDIYKLAATWI